MARHRVALSAVRHHFGSPPFCLPKLFRVGATSTASLPLPLHVARPDRLGAGIEPERCLIGAIRHAAVHGQAKRRLILSLTSLRVSVGNHRSRRHVAYIITVEAELQLKTSRSCNFACQQA